MVNRVVVAGVVAGVGLVLVVVGCILIPVFDGLVEDTVVEAARYQNGSDGYDNFVNSSSPTYTYFYFFNLTNPEDVLNGFKPVVEEIGPYVYRTTKPKNTLQFSEDGTQISYRSNNTYWFIPEMSNGDPYNDKITTVNLIVMAAAHTLESYPLAGLLLGPLLKWNTRQNGDQVFEPFIVNDYLWGYYENSTAFLGDDATNGLFYGVNGTQTDEIVVFTGTDDIDLVNEMYTWKGLEYASWTDLYGRVSQVWESPSANMLNGTDGTQYKPFIEKEDLLYTFSTDLCRGFKMLYDSEQDVKGINTYRFVIDPANFADVPENEGFCLPNASYCLPEGLLNVERCYENVPLVASLPHFYAADPEFQKTIIGMNPQKELHETAIDVEPTTGISLQGNKRLQISFQIKQYKYFNASQIPAFADGLILPIFWLNEYSVISESDAEDFIAEVIEPLELLEIIQYVVIGLGAFIMLVSLIVLAYFQCAKSRKDRA